MARASYANQKTIVRADEDNDDEVTYDHSKEIDRMSIGDAGSIDVSEIALAAAGGGADNPVPDMYHSYKYGDCIPRSGKLFSYTFWRTKANSDVFWSIQGNNEMEGAIGGVWMATQYFGNPATAARFQQQITLTHPTEHRIQMTYASTLEEGSNCVFVSKSIVQHFRNEDNSIDFDFKIVRTKKTHRSRKKNIR